MWSLMMHQQAERFILLTIVKELYRMLCRQRSGIPHLLFILTIVTRLAKSWVIVFALTIKDMIVVKALGLHIMSPFAYDTRLVTSFLQQLWEESLGRVDTLSQLSLPILMAVESCHQASTAWR